MQIFYDTEIKPLSERLAELIKRRESKIYIKQYGKAEKIKVNVISPEQDYHNGVIGERAFDPGDPPQSWK